MCFCFTKTSGRGYPPDPRARSARPEEGRPKSSGPPKPKAGRRSRTIRVRVTTLETDVRLPKLADDSALCRLHDLGHIVIQPGNDLDHFRLTLRVREFLGQIEQ